jgi:hypothetical protein
MVHNNRILQKKVEEEIYKTNNVADIYHIYRQPLSRVTADTAMDILTHKSLLVSEDGSRCDTITNNQ